jgi:uncharacterized protein (DUF4415 family)
LAETDFRKDDEAATIELTYSTPSGINRARPAPGGLIVRIIQVVRLRDARPRKVAVSVRLDAQVLTWLRSKGDGHLTRINDILTNLMEAEQRTRPGR